ncbi:hypothetical protein MP228_000729 [Amoeboaphelidium protococcarum]|nr:hypothetical protein MP228_000729 [Amoeboaphelidium protococcarum]
MDKFLVLFVAFISLQVIASPVGRGESSSSQDLLSGFGGRLDNDPEALEQEYRRVYDNYRDFDVAGFQENSKCLISGNGANLQCDLRPGQPSEMQLQKPDSMVVLLDLDSTLAEAVKYEIASLVAKERKSAMPLGLKVDDQYVYVVLRVNALEWLSEIGQLYNVGLWTAGTESYARAFVAAVNAQCQQMGLTVPFTQPDLVYSRNMVTRFIMTKEMRYLQNLDVRKTVLIDNSVNSFSADLADIYLANDDDETEPEFVAAVPTNGIKVEDFTVRDHVFDHDGSRQSQIELDQIEAFLKHISDYEDIRPELIKYNYKMKQQSNEPETNPLQEERIR